MNRQYLRMGLSISLGLCFGAVWGMALQNLASINLVGAGIALGVSLGTVFGAALNIAPNAVLARKKAAADTPLPHPLGLFER